MVPVRLYPLHAHPVPRLYPTLYPVGIEDEDADHRPPRNRRLLKKSGKESPKTGDDPQAGSDVESTRNIGEIPARNKLGKPATIETNHVFCPTEGCRGFHVLGPHQNHWIVGAGTYTTKGEERRQMFQCQWCKAIFSETRGTVFFGFKTPSETIYRALASLAEGMALTARITSCISCFTFFMVVWSVELVVCSFELSEEHPNEIPNIAITASIIANLKLF